MFVCVCVYLGFVCVRFWVHVLMQVCLFAFVFKYVTETDESIVKQGKNVRRIIFCSGKVYFDLVARRKKTGVKVRAASIHAHTYAH